MRRALAALLALAGLAGCGTTDAVEGGGRVVGDAVTVYSALPAPGRGASRDTVDGMKLALAQAGGRAAGLGVNFVSVDSGEPGEPERPAATAALAEAIIRDPQVMAVIGFVESRAATTAVPLFNAAGVLLASPGAGYPGFTARVGPGEPERWFPLGRRTFARLVPDDREQARALVAAAAAAGPRVAVEQEPGRTARALGDAVRAVIASDAGRAAAAGDGETGANAGAAAGLRLVERDPDAVIHAGERLDGAVALARREREATLVFPDALTRAGVAAALPAEARDRAVLVSSAPEPGSTPELEAFEAAFAEAYGRAPGRYAIQGHAAMARVLSALDRAGASANLRSRVIDAFFVVPPDPAGFVAVRPD